MKRNPFSVAVQQVTLGGDSFGTPITRTSIILEGI